MQRAKWKEVRMQCSADFESCSLRGPSCVLADWKSVFTARRPGAAWSSLCRLCRSNSIRTTMKTLNDLFLDTLADIFDAEHRITEALPKLAEAAHSDDLREAFENHLSETEGHIKKVERVFSAF